MNKRVIFKKGYQKVFIKKPKKKSHLTWEKLSKKLGLNSSTLSKSYYFELSSIPYNTFEKMAAIINTEEKIIVRKYKIDIKNEEKIIGRRVMGEQKKKFYPVQLNFRKSNLNLDISQIKFSHFDVNKMIKIPSTITESLAEEIGIHLGDGFLSSKRFDYRLKGNKINEKEYYIHYIAPLYKELYNINTSLKYFDSCFGFEVSSKALWEFKTKVIGIRPGKKEVIQMPEILKVNNVKIISAFVRGFFDTDGCLSFKSKYGYKEYYPVIEINQFSKEIIKDLGEILTMMGFNPCVYLNKKYGKISINGIGAFKRYHDLIGWKSQKNLNKVNEWKNQYPELMTDVA